MRRVQIPSRTERDWGGGGGFLHCTLVHGRGNIFLSGTLAGDLHVVDTDVSADNRHAKSSIRAVSRKPRDGLSCPCSVARRFWHGAVASTIGPLLLTAFFRSAVVS